MRVGKVIFIVLVASTLLVSLSCKKRDNSPLIPDGPPDRGEVITTVKIIFTDSLSGISKSYTFSDPDGPGGKPAYYGPDPLSQTDSVITLDEGSVYYSELLLLNESVSPIDTVSHEVEEEGEEHMIFYDNGSPLPLTNLNPASVQLIGGTQLIYTDKDVNQNSIGLLTTWKLGSGEHLLRIVVKHQPQGKDGSVTTGETDVEVYFRLRS